MSDDSLGLSAIRSHEIVVTVGLGFATRYVIQFMHQRIDESMIVNRLCSVRKRLSVSLRFQDGVHGVAYAFIAFASFLVTSVSQLAVGRYIHTPVQLGIIAVAVVALACIWLNLVSRLEKVDEAPILLSNGAENHADPDPAISEMIVDQEKWEINVIGRYTLLCSFAISLIVLMLTPGIPG